MSTTVEPAVRAQPLTGPDWLARIWPAMPAGGWRGWIGPIVVTVIAAILRIPNLGRPRAFAFDETYYAKDALSLLRFGTEQRMADKANDIILGSNGDPWTLNPFETGPAYVVHPPFGKWVIGAGEYVFGVTPTGWRVGVLICGLLAVLAVARITRRLVRSNFWGTVAGLLFAFDGLAIVLSRTAVLDNVLMLCVLGAFGALLLDRDHTRRRLAAQLEPGVPPWIQWPQGPRLGALRGWRIVAAVLLGLACGVKWSGVWYVVAFGLLTVLWDVGLRRTTGAPKPWTTTLVRDALPTAVMWVVVVSVVYLATWSGWFLTDTGYYRDWAASQPSSFVPEAWGWPVLARPTSFFYEEAATCGADKCSQEVLALGNPLIWWAAVVALFHQAWRWAARRDWRSGAVLLGFLAGWAPWLMFQERTVFSFYSIVFLPFTVMALTMSLGSVRGRAPEGSRRDVVGIVAVAVFLAGVVAASAFFYPIWTAQSIPYSQWNLRMWFPSWV